MKKTIFLIFTVFLAGCSAQNTPNFILKQVNEDAYNRKILMQECKKVIQNRVVIVDGVAGYYDYNSNNGAACAKILEEVLQPYQNPSRHAADREDIKPLGKMN
jgi:hypothetical protein